MAQSPTERVTALERIVDTHTIRLGALDKEVAAVYDAHSAAVRNVTALKRDFDREIALLQREVAELRKWQDNEKTGREEWGRKLWMIVPPVLAVFISNALTLAIAYYLRK